MPAKSRKIAIMGFRAVGKILVVFTYKARLEVAGNI